MDSSHRDVRARLVASLAICVLLLGILIQQVTSHGPLTGLDGPSERFAVAHRSHLLTNLMRAFSEIGSTSFLLPLILISITYFVFRDRDWRAPAALAAAFVTDILVQDAVKKVVGRHRPPLSFMIGRYPPGSFPSGHTTQSVVVYGLIALLLIRTHPQWSRVPILFGAGLIVMCVGASRIYLGAHWLSDVAGGLVLGAFWIVVLHALFPFLLRQKTPRGQITEFSEPSPGDGVQSEGDGTSSKW